VYTCGSTVSFYDLLSGSIAVKDIIRDLADKDQHNLKLQFQVGLGIILFCFCLFIATIIYHFQKNLLKEETLRQTELVMGLLESTRNYIHEVLRPRMYQEIGEDQFIIEAMSTSYITRVIMERFKDELPVFKYRRVALDARNPGFEANHEEQKMINYFQNHPNLQEWHGTTKIESSRYFTMYRPIVFNNSCLHCHGIPEEAPVTIREKYGIERGFYRNVNQIGGVLSISIPLDESIAQIWDRSFRMFGTIFILATLLYSAVWLLFHQLIITNLRDLLTLFRNSIDENDSAPIPHEIKGHREELEELFRNARTLVAHLHDSRSRLVGYTDNLEVLVAERTEALERSENMARDQVKKRNRELMLYNTLTGLITSTETLKNILHQVLHEVLEVVPANGAGIYLYNDKEDLFALQCAEKAPMLAPVHQAIEHTNLNIVPSEIYDMLNISIPLCCRNRLLGIMVITELRCEVLNDAFQELLLSIGQQIGLTIESLHNMQNLRQSTRLLQSVFDGISDLLILLAPDGSLKMANQTFLQKYDLGMSDAIGMNITTILSQQQSLSSVKLQAIDLLAKEPHTKEIQLNDGTIFDTFFYPILQPDASVHSIICFAKDVTSIKETEQRIQQTEKLVAVGQLAAGVAHEINNPLGVILCYTDILKENDSYNEELIHDISVIERHAENCRRIVADLLDFSRSAESRLEKQVESINDVIENVLTMVQQQFKKNRIKLICKLDHDLPRCCMDTRRMQQVVLNLVMNGIQAIDKDGTVSIVTTTEDDSIVVDIKDDGPGIKKGTEDSIFDPFFSTKDPGQGTGLGLSVSYGIVQEHDGEIRVKSTAGQGAHFSIILPVYKESEYNE
jgi:PAS domain S-box-containing protein